MRKYLLILFALTLLAPGQELIRNGDFEDGLEAWLEQFDNPQGTYEIAVDTIYHPDPDNEVRIYKYMRYFARLSQAVDIPGTDLLFSGSAQLRASKGSTSGYYAYAALILEYLDSDEQPLGRTMILNKVGTYDPQNTPTQSVHLVTSSDWEQYELALSDELARLTGISPADVTGINVILESYGTGASG